VPRIIWRLPDHLLYRLRDELLEVVRNPIPLPDPPPELIDPGVIDPLPEPPRPLPELYLCIWEWLHPFFEHDVDCVTTVMVDENGEFETTIFYPCFGDKPDLYFRAEQWQGSSWETIYAPSVACHTHWNYACGSEVTLVATGPSVIPCEPPPDIDLPPGIDTWVMPFQVGLTEIWGTPAGSPTPAPPSAGWVKPNGMTDYGGVTDAPFGGYLPFTMGHSNDVPSDDVKY